MSGDHRALSVLLIEGNPKDAGLVRQFLESPWPSQAVQLLHVETIEQAIGRLDDSRLDAVMIGLEAPDISVLDALKDLRARASDLPTIVLIRPADDKCGVEAIRAGAQDCLFKDQIDAALLSRSLRFAIERNKHAVTGAEPAGTKHHKEEFDSWAAMCSPAPLRVARKSFGQSSLKEAAPVAFDDLVRRYQVVLEHSLEERTMRVSKGVAEELKDLADLLGGLGAGPRDVVAIHAGATSAKLSGVPLLKAKAYVVEGRILLLKLMGDLVSFYRNLSWGETSAARAKLPASKARPIRARDPGMTRK